MIRSAILQRVKSYLRFAYILSNLNTSENIHIFLISTERTILLKYPQI